MGVSTNGQIAFGYSFEEETEFPWGDDVEAWWRKVRGYTPEVELYDADGNYLNGIEPSKEATSAYYAAQRAWDKANPMPVEIELHCSYDYPMCIIAVPGTCYSNRRGFPQEIDPAALVVTAEQRASLDAFCNEFDIEIPGEAKWWLTSMLG